MEQAQGENVAMYEIESDDGISGPLAVALLAAAAKTGSRLIAVHATERRLRATFDREIDQRLGRGSKVERLGRLVRRLQV